MINHPTADDLEHLPDTGSDHERMLSHLAAGDTSRSADVDIARYAPEPAAPLDPEPFVEPRLAPARPARLWSRPVVWISVTAAAAAIALGMFGVLLPFRDSSSEVRPAAVAAVSPVGIVSAVTELRWSGPIAATAYKVVVRDAHQDMMFEMSGSATRAQFPEELRLAPGKYTWTIDAFDAAGASLGPTLTQAFEIR